MTATYIYKTAGRLDSNHPVSNPSQLGLESKLGLDSKRQKDAMSSNSSGLQSSGTAGSGSTTAEGRTDASPSRPHGREKEKTPALPNRMVKDLVSVFKPVSYTHLTLPTNREV